MNRREVETCDKKIADVGLQRCKNYQLANLFPARAVALGCLYAVMEERGLRTANERIEWVDEIASRKVDKEDFEEVLEMLRGI